MKTMITLICSLVMTTALCGAPPACYKELQDEAFPYQRVVQAFDTASIPATSWAYLYSQLQSRKSKIPTLIRKQASALNPNPLNDPFQAEIAVELLKRAEYAVFYEVLSQTRYNYVNDINQMFSFIFQMHANKIYRCLGVDIINQQKIPD